MSYIFISYSQKDKAYVQNLHHALIEKGFDARLDDRTDEYGSSWPQEIQELLDECSAIILVMSPNSKNSDWVRNELRVAQGLNKPIFSLLLEGEFWLQLQPTQVIDVTDAKTPPVDFYLRLERTIASYKIDPSEKQKNETTNIYIGGNVTGTVIVGRNNDVKNMNDGSGATTTANESITGTSPTVDNLQIDKLILQDMTELLERNELTVYLGPDLPEVLSGVPGWSDLAARLAERGGFRASDWPVAATRYDQISGRRNLIDWLDGQVNDCPPGPLYTALAKLPVSKYIATTYDELLQSSLRTAGRQPNIVIENSDLTSIKTNRPTVIKLFGEVSAGRRDALLLTNGDLRELTQRRAAILAQEVQPAFTRTSLLILGQNPNTKFFRDLYHQYTEQAGPLVRRSFIVWSGLESWEIDDWKTDEVAVLDANPLTLIETLLSTYQK